MTSISYDVADYVDILKAQMSEKDFINTKRKIFLLLIKSIPFPPVKKSRTWG